MNNSTKLHGFTAAVAILRAGVTSPSGSGLDGSDSGDTERSESGSGGQR